MTKQAVAIFSPAKINLTLAITERRADGFHNLVSVVGPINFGDILYVSEVNGDKDVLTCTDPEIPLGDENLIIRAAEAYRKEFDSRQCYHFHLEKKIPLGAGLGGGSSNAIAALKAIDFLKYGKIQTDKFISIAQKLGSDCTLFLNNGPVIMRGRGEEIAPIQSIANIHKQRILLFKPAFSINTAWAYNQMREAEQSPYLSISEGEHIANSCISALQGGRLSECNLVNNMEGVVFEKHIALPVVFKEIKKLFGLNCRMSGSGSACYIALPEKFEESQTVTEKLREFLGKDIFIIETTLFPSSTIRDMSQSGPEIILKGIAASPGVISGTAFVFLQKELDVPMYHIEPEAQSRELARFEESLIKTRNQITLLRQEVAGKLGEKEAQVFDAHLLLIEDRALIDETIAFQAETNCNIDYCFNVISKKFITEFDNIDDAYIKERGTDVRDVSKRILQNLLGKAHVNISQILTQPRVVISEDFSPSEAVGIPPDKIQAIVTDKGSRTSHAVIMARSLNVPAVVGLHDITWNTKSGNHILVDGYDGVVIVNPSNETLFRYGKLIEERSKLQQIFASINLLPSTTQDGHSIPLMANIEGLQDVQKIRECGASGVGLFRTESLFLRKNAFPSEEEQFEEYKNIVQRMAPDPVIIRTIDLGGDKLIQHLTGLFAEANPFMGFRAIRLCLKHKEFFKEQLRAILRASAFGQVKIMYPMISCVDELIAANELLKEAKQELRSKEIAFNENILVGSMIEIPSAAFSCDLLAKHCSFFSIGTNDLIQYMLAVDRVNDNIAHLYEPNHPAITRIIKLICETARSHNIPVAVCGEMAGDPLYAPLLLGLGVSELSVSPNMLSEIKFLIRSVSLKETSALAESILQASDTAKNALLLKKFYTEKIKRIY